MIIRSAWIPALWKPAASVALAFAGVALLFAGLSANPATAAPNVTCTTNVSTNITTNQQWNLIGSPYCVNSQITVATGATLTIDPGVIVYFASGAAMGVYGNLIANGTSSQGIVFTAKSDTPTPGFWRYFTIQSGGSANFNYTDISYAGLGNSWALSIYATNVQVRNSRIHDNTGHGIRIWGNNLAPLVEDSRIDHNTNVAILVSGGDGNTPTLRRLQVDSNSSFPLQETTGIGGSSTNMPVYEDLTFSGNLQDVFLFEACSLIISRTIDTQSEFNGAPVQVNAGSLTVKSGVVLTLTAGTTLQFNAGSGTLIILNGGKVVGVGTQEKPVRFTSDSAVPQPGDWRKIDVSTGGHLRLSYCDISYGGDSNNAMVNLLADDVQIDHCRIHHAKADAVRIHGNNGHTVTFTDSTIDHNLGWAITENPGGYVYRSPAYKNLNLHDNGHDAVYLVYQDLRSDRTFDGPGMLNGRPFILEGVLVYQGMALTITPGTTLRFIPDANFDVSGHLIAQGTPNQPIVFTSNEASPQPGDWAGITFSYSSHTSLSHCEVGYAGMYGWGVMAYGQDLDFRQCWIHDIEGDGYRAAEDNLTPVENLVVADSVHGVYVNSGVTLKARHLTLQGNEVGVLVDQGSAVLTNTILADNTLGAHLYAGDLKLVKTLWDGNATASLVESGGSLNEIGHIDGAAKILADGRHIACSSDAVAQGLPLSSLDLDGEPRPQPVSSLPDLGADESPCGEAVSFVAHKLAYHPQWQVDLKTLSGRLFQEYLIDFFYGGGGGGAPLEVLVSDTLPNELDFTSQSSSLPAVFGQAGQELTWDLQNPLMVGKAGYIQLEGDYDSLAVGEKIVNHAEVDAGSYHVPLVITSTLEQLFPPLLVSSGDGETCYGKNTITGMGMPGLTAQLIVNSAMVSETTISASGQFTFTYQYVSQQTEDISARVCSASLCSPNSDLIVFTPQQSFWCPRQTDWKLGGKTYKFRDGSGLFNTLDSRIVLPIQTIINGSQLDLGVGEYPVHSGSPLMPQDPSHPSAPTVTPPDEIYIDISGYHYTPSETYFSPDFNVITYRFILSGAYVPPGQCTAITVYARYGDTWITAVLNPCSIDPDGTVFDATQGFDPADPTVNAISGVTVTCMMSMPEWGGWVSWPAQLYDEQENPQVTGEDGYFAFFTPPGKYFLQVEGASGFQDWRSPVIEVISEVVHVNVPLTPWPTGEAVQVALAPQGPDPASLVIPPGGVVEWLSTLDPGEAALHLLDYTENPFLHPLSELDPLASTLGFDGGMMPPGAVYRRQFDTEGTYTYSDEAGHSGTIVVGTGYSIYLPVVRR